MYKVGWPFRTVESRSYRTLAARMVVLAPVLASVCAMAPAAASAAPPGTTPYDYSATLATSNQSMWGPGATPAPKSISDTWFDQKWNRPDEFNGEFNGLVGA